MTSTPTRFTLRQLPLATRLVLTLFLFAVGLGYTSAMVQLHLKHSNKEGNPLPTVADVIERFSGLKKPDANTEPPKSKIHQLLLGPKDDADVGKENMTPAFFAKSKGYEADCKARGKLAVDAEREGELAVALAWLTTEPGLRKSAYEQDRFPLTNDLKGKSITAAYLDSDKAAVKIKTLVDGRCQNCHKEQTPDLGSYAALDPLITAPSQEVLPGGWVRSSKQMTIESLTQSTHAHLLSFAVLFTLTGVIFSLTGYPGIIRGVVAPIVLLAQVTDVCCWWLARVPDYGPLFAQAIIGTGSIVGLGLSIQIILGVFAMYGTKGKAVILGLLLAGSAMYGYVATKLIFPALQEEKDALTRQKLDAAAAKTDVKTTTPKAEPPKVEPPKTNGADPVPVPPARTVSALERIIMGPIEGATWNGKGSMAPAFFHKDGADYKKLIKDRKKDEVDAEREGERLAVQAWILLPEPARKEAFAKDKLTLPTPRVGKPITPDYVAEDKSVKVKSILTDRCTRCHAKGAEQEDYPLEAYEEFLKYIEGKTAPAPSAKPAEPEGKPIPKID